MSAVAMIVPRNADGVCFSVYHPFAPPKTALTRPWRSCRDCVHYPIMSRRRRLFLDAIAFLIAAQIGRDELRQEADRHHLGAQQQCGCRVDERRTLVQRVKPGRLDEAKHPGES